MATITLQVVAGANTYTNTRTVSTPDLQRLANALRVHFSAPSASDSEVIALWASLIFSQAKTIVRDYEGEAAKAAITDISLT